MPPGTVHPPPARAAGPRSASPLRVASVLGVVALIPFAAGALLVWLVGPDARAGAALALSTYAAVVASFIGAIHWGLAFRQDDPDPSLLLWGVAPSIVAWLAVLAPFRAGLVVLALLLAVCYLVDRRVYVREGVTAWLPLRRRLTVAATLCCLAGAFAR